MGEDGESDWAETVLAERNVRLLQASRVPGGRLSRCIILVEPDGRRTILNEPLQVGRAALAAWRAAIPGERLPALFVQGDQVLSLAELMASPAFAQLFSVTQIGSGDVEADWLDRLAPLFSLVVISREAAHRLLAGGGGTTDLVERTAAALRGMAGMVALTLGAEGAVLICRGEVVARAAAPAVEVVDETGAGDTFTGVLDGRTAARRGARGRPGRCRSRRQHRRLGERCAGASPHRDPASISFASLCMIFDSNVSINSPNVPAPRPERHRERQQRRGNR